MMAVQRINIIKDIITLFQQNNWLEGIEINFFPEDKKKEDLILEFVHLLRNEFNKLNKALIISCVFTQYIFQSEWIYKTIEYFNFISIFIDINTHFGFQYRSFFTVAKGQLFSTKYYIPSINHSMHTYGCMFGNLEKFNIIISLDAFVWKDVRTELDIQLESNSNSIHYPVEYNNAMNKYFISWSELNKRYNGTLDEFFDEETQTPYILDRMKNEFISFENERSLTAKIQYAYEYGIGGIHINGFNFNYENAILFQAMESAHQKYCNNVTRIKYNCNNTTISVLWKTNSSSAEIISEIHESNIWNNNNMISIIVIGFTFSVLAFFIVAVLLYYMRNKKSFIITISNQFAIEKFEQIGKGRFGSVYMCEWEDEKVAVKVMDHENEWTRRQMGREAAILADLYHPNICDFHGLIELNGTIFGLEGTRLALVMEFAPFGNLLEFLHARSPNCASLHPLLPSELIRISLMIAEGLQYLKKQNIVHENLTLNNCLVFEYFSFKDEKYIIKLTDHSQMKFISKADFYEKIASKTKKNSLKFFAPEILSKYKFSYASDVWSFGTILFFLFFRENLQKLILEQENDDELNRENTDSIQSKNANIFPLGFPFAMETLIRRCWMHFPQHRIDISDVIHFLQQIDMNDERNKIDYMDMNDDFESQEFFDAVSHHGSISSRINLNGVNSAEGLPSFDSANLNSNQQLEESIDVDELTPSIYGTCDNISIGTYVGNFQQNQMPINFVNFQQGNSFLPQQQHFLTNYSGNEFGNVQLQIIQMGMQSIVEVMDETNYLRECITPPTIVTPQKQSSNSQRNLMECCSSQIPDDQIEPLLGNNESMQTYPQSHNADQISSHHIQIEPNEVMAIQQSTVQMFENKISQLQFDVNQFLEIMLVPESQSTDSAQISAMLASISTISNQIFTQLEPIQTHLNEQLQNWMAKQKNFSFGSHDFRGLRHIEELRTYINSKYRKFTELLAKCLEKCEQLSNGHQIMCQHFAPIKQQFFYFTQNFLLNSLIISQQPPSYVERLPENVQNSTYIFPVEIVGLGFDVFLNGENVGKKFQIFPSIIQVNTEDGNWQISEHFKMEHTSVAQKNSETYFADRGNVKMKAFSKKERGEKVSGHVPDQPHFIQFLVEIKCLKYGLVLQRQLNSLRFCIVTNRSMEIEAKGFLLRAFPTENGNGYREVVAQREMEDALDYKFNSIISSPLLARTKSKQRECRSERELDRQMKAHLSQMLGAENGQILTINFLQKEICNFKTGDKQPFYEWFFGLAAEFIRKDNLLLKMWNRGLIYGFCSDVMAEGLLKGKRSPALLIRFSNTEAKTLKISMMDVKSANKEVKHYGCSFTNSLGLIKELLFFSRIIGIQYIYPRLQLEKELVALNDPECNKQMKEYRGNVESSALGQEYLRNQRPPVSVYFRIRGVFSNIQQQIANTIRSNPN